MSFLFSVARALNPLSWLLRPRRKEDVIQSEYEFQPEVEVDPADDVDSSNGQVSDSSEAEIEERVTKNDGKRRTVFHTFSEEAPQLHDDGCSDQNPPDSATVQDRLSSNDNACSLQPGDEFVQIEQLECLLLLIVNISFCGGS
ncbi:unnamed protein product [Heligmosomoides polygyrus]|uniref:Uncharacterized protein n=1 Tax=Heligmosomoides polygyrus TaxID=6339 RepID=A0A183GT99_HELPZ|nr:unnamed protein product [Heligmosomoides polygyrus]